MAADKQSQAKQIGEVMAGDQLIGLTEKLKEKGALGSEPTTTCPFDICDGSGYVKNEEGYPEAECECQGRSKDEIEYQRKKNRKARLKRAAIPPRYDDMCFDTFELEGKHDTQRYAYKAAKRYVDVWPEPLERGFGIYFSGKSGIGKSHLAVSIVRDVVLKYDVKAYVLPMNRFIRRLKPKNNNEHEAFESKLFNVELLLLEDVGGRGRQTEWVTEKMNSVIEERYLNELPTIFTSNRTRDELKKLERICPGWVPLVSRLKGITFEIPMEGESMREFDIESLGKGAGNDDG